MGVCDAGRCGRHAAGRAAGPLSLWRGRTSSTLASGSAATVLAVMAGAAAAAAAHLSLHRLRPGIRLQDGLHPPPPPAPTSTMAVLAVLSVATACRGSTATPRPRAPRSSCWPFRAATPRPLAPRMLAPRPARTPHLPLARSPGSGRPQARGPTDGRAVQRQRGLAVRPGGRALLSFSIRGLAARPEGLAAPGCFSE